jgi:hypothetical protein
MGKDDELILLVERVARRWQKESKVYKTLDALNNSSGRNSKHHHNFRRADILETPIGTTESFPRTYVCSPSICNETAYYCRICDGYLLGVPKKTKYNTIRVISGSRGDQYHCAHKHEIGRVVRERSLLN